MRNDLDDGIVVVVMTTRDYLDGPEDLRRRELVWGVVREPPSPFFSHQVVTTRIAALLDQHVRQQELGVVVVAPMDVVLDETRHLVVQPDVMFISYARREIIENVIRGAPDLVVEVASPGTAKYDRTEKLAWYRRYGVHECWLVDGEREIVTVIDLTTKAAGVSYTAQDTVASQVLPRLSVTARALTT